MVEDRKTVLSDKANNALKHIAIPVLELTDLVYNEEDDGWDFYVRDRSTGMEFCSGIPMDDDKEVIKDFLEHLYNYRSVKVTGVKSIDENRFTLDNLPASFSIVGLPDRQIKIESAGKVNFINLQRPSYDKVRAKLNKPCMTLDFDELANCLIRKELLVLLLTLNAL